MGSLIYKSLLNYLDLRQKVYFNFGYYHMNTYSQSFGARHPEATA